MAIRLVNIEVSLLRSIVGSKFKALAVRANKYICYLTRSLYSSYKTRILFATLSDTLGTLRVAYLLQFRSK